jgi:hypothetical protein
LEMIEDHARIRGLVMHLSDEAIGGNVRLETLNEIGERLEALIRLEERVAFPLIEESSHSPEMVRKNPPPLDPLRPPQSCDDAHRRGP